MEESRNLKPDSLERRVNKSWKSHNRIIKLRNKIGSVFIELGRELYNFQKKRYYIEQGYETFESYLGSIGLSRSTAYAWKAIYEVFVLKYNISLRRLATIPWSKLEKIRSRVNNENIDEMLFMARDLSISDLDKETKERVYRTFEICKGCGGIKSEGVLRMCEGGHHQQAEDL